MKPLDMIGFKGALVVWGLLEWHTRQSCTNLSIAERGKQSYSLDIYKWEITAITKYTNALFPQHHPHLYHPTHILTHSHMLHMYMYTHTHLLDSLLATYVAFFIAVNFSEYVKEILYKGNSSLAWINSRIIWVFFFCWEAQDILQTKNGVVQQLVAKTNVTSVLVM